MRSTEWGFMKFKADAQKCYDELIEAYGEKFTPHQVLDLARDPETELHKCFLWDDSAAAEKWRLHQARQVCQSFTIVVQQRDKKEPQQFRLVQHDREDQVYRPIIYSVRDSEQYARLLRQAKDELASFRKRYKCITELESVIDEIDALLAQ
jgi:hypothetical protein